MLWVAWVACGGGGDKQGPDGDGTSAHSATPPTTDEKFERCVRRCTRGSDGPSCDTDAIQSTCEDYCVDPPPLPAACDPYYQDYETCVGPIDEWTCVGSTTRVGDIVVPVPTDPYECRLESLELASCSTLTEPGCVPVLGGSGAACTLDAALCNANGVTFDANLLCDGVICSLLVDDGTGPVDSTLPRADQLCAELTEKAALSDEELGRFLVTLTDL